MTSCLHTFAGNSWIGGKILRVFLPEAIVAAGEGPSDDAIGRGIIEKCYCISYTSF